MARHSFERIPGDEPEAIREINKVAAFQKPIYEADKSNFGKHSQAAENFQFAVPTLEKLVKDSPENAVNRDDLKKLKKLMNS